MSLKIAGRTSYKIIELLYENINCVDVIFNDNTYQRITFIAKEMTPSETENADILKLGIVINVNEVKTVVRLIYMKKIEDEVLEIWLAKDTNIILNPGQNIIIHEIKMNYEEV
jgi:hypothetical protein